MVTRAQIEDEGARTLADALANVPGVELFPYGAFGAQVDYGIRGATSARTLVLVDGQPIADPTTAEVYLAQLSTVGVERIEVVESASSALYGTSASGGVINVITRVPRGEYVEGSLGSYGDRDVRATVGNGTIGGSFERRVATNDYSYPALTYGGPACKTIANGTCAFPSGVRDNADGRETVGRIDANVPLGLGFTARARADLASLDIGVPNSLAFLTPNTRSRSTNRTGLVEIARASADNTFTVDVSGADQRGSYADPSFGSDDTVWGRSQLSLKDAVSAKRADLVAGIDLSRSSGRFAFPAAPGFGTTPATPAYAIGASQAQSAAYVQVGTSPFEGARVTAGLRAEHDAPAGSVLAPSFGAVFRPAKNVRLAGNVSESFSVPTLTDLYYPGYANPNLLPEKSQNSDATLSFDASHGSLSVGWFARNGSNFIVLDSNFVPQNAQRASTAGIVVSARSAPYRGIVGDVSFTDLYRSLDLVTGARLPRQPVGQASAGITKPFGTTSTAFGVRFNVVGSDGDDTANVPPPLTGRYDSYSSLDAYLRYRFAPSAVVSVRGFNLGDDREAPIFGYPNVGRRFTVEVSTR